MADLFNEYVDEFNTSMNDLDEKLLDITNTEDLTEK